MFNAFIASPSGNAVPVEQAIVEIFTGRTGRKQLRGRGLVRNVGLVDLLEDGDRLDLYLDLGATFRFVMKNPKLQAGKVFSPTIRSLVHFYPRQPWEAIDDAAFDAIANQMSFLEPT